MRYREWEVWCRCDRCADFTNVVFWVRRLRDGSHEARLEGSATAVRGDDALIHRPGHCGGALRLLDPMPDETHLL